MEVSKQSYEKALDKELSDLKSKIRSDYIKIGILIVFSIVIYFIEKNEFFRNILILGSVGYGITRAYILYKNYSRYTSLLDELHIEDGEILKFNPRQQKSKKRIPIGSIQKVYMDIEDKVHTFYIVYKKDGNLFAEGFYKHRVQEKEKFMEMMKEMDLLTEEPISFEELKAEIENKD